jgi:hypothetical protein
MDRHGSLTGGAVTIAFSRSSNGLTSLRQTTMLPTTSSSISMGAAIVVRKPATRWRSLRPQSGSVSTSGICWVVRSRPTRPISVSRSIGIGCSAMYSIDSLDSPTALMSR